MKAILTLLTCLMLTACHSTDPNAPRRPKRYKVWYQPGVSPDEARMAVARANMEKARGNNPLAAFSPGAFWMNAANQGNIFKYAMEAQGYKVRVITTNDNPHAAEFPRP